MRTDDIYPQISFGYNDSIKLLQKEFNYIKKITESYDDLSDIEKFELFNHFINIRYNTHDIINLINIKAERNYTRTVDIPTKMETEFTESEGRGRDFSWWTDIIRLVLTCATHDKFELKNTVYSYKEIMDLIDDRVIYPINIYGVEIIRHSEDRELPKKIETFNTEVLDVTVDECGYWDNKLIIKPKEENTSLIVKYLEKNISKEQLFKFVKLYFKNLFDYMDYCDYWYDSCANGVQDLYNEMVEYYNTYFKGKRKIKKRG